jgi:hypothetical protein
MFTLIYELVLYDFLGWTSQTNEYLNLESLALAITTVLMVIATIGIFKIAVILLSIPFRFFT